MTKSDASNRVLPMPPDMKRYFRKLKAKQAEQKLRFGQAYTNTGYVCCWPDGNPIKPDYVSRKFCDLLNEKGLPHIRFHDLRHTAGTLLRESGYALQDIMRWLGHADIKMTMPYAHPIEGVKVDMAKSMNRVFAVGG